MVVLHDIRTILCSARIFGGSSYIVIHDSIKVTAWSVIFSIVYAIIYFISAVVTLYFYAKNLDEPKLLTLSFVRVFLSYSCIFSDLTFTMMWNGRIRSALSQLRNFDRATKFDDSHRGGRIRKICDTAVVLTVIFWTIVGYLSYRCESTMAVIRGVTYGMVNIALSVQILTFAGMSFLLHERFHQLCKMLMFSEESKIMVVDRSNGQFGLQEIWWLHCCLANATEMINSTYAIQLLLWIACMAFNTLSRIYTLNEDTHLPMVFKIREFMLVIAFVGNLLVITTICHVTAYRANQVGEVIFSPLSPVLSKRSFIQENVEAVAYFQRRKVHFFAIAGFIRIDLPLLFSIASGITTYLVILHAANNE